jgi:hypothetical protein|mmetsp:Transcript_46446/g.73373  ORF Transcript_46446/g.73373 Transcript_46446/m.73373 type:complete len:84 (+) Transcript_46446:249-500(+)
MSNQENRSATISTIFADNRKTKTNYGNAGSCFPALAPLEVLKNQEFRSMYKHANFQNLNSEMPIDNHSEIKMDSRYTSIFSMP